MHQQANNSSLVYNGQVISQRPDGYVNATQMAKANGVEIRKSRHPSPQVTGVFFDLASSTIVICNFCPLNFLLKPLNVGVTDDPFFIRKKVIICHTLKPIPGMVLTLFQNPEFEDTFFEKSLGRSCAN